MANEQNLLATLHGRRVQNFKTQFKSVLLEGYEIFGPDIVEPLISECRTIFEEYSKMAPNPIE